MARFEITGPDGKRYQVEGETAEGALAALRKHVETPKQGGDEPAAVGRALIEGVPIVGPSLLSGLNATAAGVRSLQSGKPYAEEREAVERFSDATAKENPGSTLGGNIAGGVLGTAPLVMAAPAAFGASAAPMAARMIASAGTGGALNAADTIARGGDDKAIRNNAMIGLSAGALGPVAMGVGEGVVRAGAGMAASVPFLPERLRNAAGRFAGDDRVARALLNSGKDQGAIADSMEQARTLGKGEEYTLADALGPSGAKALGSAQRGPGTAHDRVVNALNDRQRAQAERMLVDLGDTMGTSGTAKQESARLLQKAKDDSGALYTKARAAELEPSERLNQFAADPEVQAGIAKGREIERLEDLAAGRTPANILEGPGPAPATPAAPAGKAPASAPAEKPPETMGQFIARNGGIELDDDFAHAGLNQFKVRSPDGKHAGAVARKDGKSLDGYWRSRLMEEGYLPPSEGGYHSRDVRAEVMDLLQREWAGSPTYRTQDAGLVESIKGAKQQVANAEALADHTSRVRRELVGLGVEERSIDKAALKEAAEASMRDGDGVATYERVLERGPANASAGAPETITAAQYKELMGSQAAGAAKEAAPPLTMAQLQQARIGLNASIEAERDAIKGLTPKGRALVEVKKALDVELEKVNPDLLEANRIYAGPMRQRDAIAAGKKAPQSRAEDNIDQFRAYTAPDEKQAYRQGYAEPWAKRLEGQAGEGVDRARQFTSPKAVKEFDEFSLDPATWRGRRELESEMSSTRHKVLGNSATADRLADDASVAPGVLSALFRGSVKDMVLAGGRAGVNAVGGNTGKVRDRVAEQLLRTAAAGGEGVVDELTAAAMKRRDIAALIYQAMVGGGRGAASARQ